MSKLRRSLAATGLTAALLGSSTAGLLALTPALAGAQDNGSSTSSTTTAPAARRQAIRKDLEKLAKERAAHYNKVLKPLVENKTITRAQADAVIKALVGDKSDWARKGRRINRGIVGFGEAAKALGMSTEELKQQVTAGKTLAEIAQDKGVSTEDLTNAMLARTKAALDKAVTDGKLTQTEADARLEQAKERIEKALNSKSLEFRVERMERLHHRLENGNGRNKSGN